MLTTELTKVLGIEHPVIQAGMGQLAGGPLVSAVSNAGGLGVVGGVLYTPEQLRAILSDVKARLKTPTTPFGVDLLIPQIGGSARKTNFDYTSGKLDELIDVIIESGARIFICAVGVPPKSVIAKLQNAGVLYGNIIGHPKHAVKACEAGADVIVAQGGEAGGQTGHIPSAILIPAVADICKKYTSPVTKGPITLMAGGGMFDGRSLAAALMLGAHGIWVGTRFVTAKESEAPRPAKDSIINADFDTTIRTLIYSGRPLRIQSTPYIAHWESHRQDEIRELTSKGILPIEHELEKLRKEGKLTPEIEEQSIKRPMGIVSALVKVPDQPAADIVQEIVMDAERLLRGSRQYFEASARL